MTARDVLDLSLGSLWRIKLRAFLTTAGVAIGIATLVAMLSFVAGNQRWVEEAFADLGLLTRINVSPKDRERNSGSPPDSSSGPVLDRAALRTLSGLPGVTAAYPFVEFEVTAAVADTQVSAKVRALSCEVMRLKPFSLVLGGSVFSSDEAAEAVITPAFLKTIGLEDGKDLVGRTMVISARVSSVDSALARAVGDPRGEMSRILGAMTFDSLAAPGYRERVLRREVGERMSRFMDGLLRHPVTVTDTLTIIAVGREIDEYQVPVSPIIVPEGTARRFGSAGIGLGGGPSDILAAVQTGDVFRAGGVEESRQFPRVTLETEPLASHEAIVDSVEALGFRAFSFAKEFEQIKRFFVYYYLGLGIVGLIALVTASLGIVNTMVMSITERRREIGILKSLGADEREIEFVFLVESGLIGCVGALVGILFGWAGTRVVAAVAKVIMVREEMPIFDPFALPVWLVAVALLVGVVVSVIAGLYPAARAARVDPVEALRGE
jgi:ABC-type antimicrobial peptide transport system permease subunit